MPNFIAHITTLDKAVDNIDTKINAVHGQLSQLYVLLNRPLDKTSQEQALGIIHNAMARMRDLSENRSYIINAAAGIDSDLGDIIDSIQRMRMPRHDEMPRTTYEGDLMPHTSPLRHSINELDEMTRRAENVRGF